MESSNKSGKIVYTKDQLLTIREAFIASGDLSRYPIANSVLSRDPEKRPYFRKPKPPSDGIAIPLRTPRRNDHYVGSYDGNGEGSAPNSAGWKRTRRTSGTSIPQSPLDPPITQRNNSSSSNGEEFGNTQKESNGQVRREFDWTLGCGKWRHRSTSGSERGAHKGGFFVSSGRGRGRGGAGNGVGGNDCSGGTYAGPTRGRGFMRRPFQHGNALPRGGVRGGFKSSVSFNNVPDHGPKEEDFEPHDEQHLQQFQNFPLHHALQQHSHQVHHEDADGPGDGEQHQQQKEKQGIPSAWDGHPTQSQTAVLNRPSTQADEQASQFVPPPSQGPDVCTHNPADSTASIAPGGGSYSFMPLNPPPPPHLLNLQSSLGPGENQVPPPPPTLWYYRDPHGNIHGPFNDATMRAWYEAGYFKSGIEMRRASDKVFSHLSEYESRLGGNPFINSKSLAPIESSLSSSTLPQSSSSLSSQQQPPMINPLENMLSSSLPINMLRSPQQAVQSPQQAASSSLQDPTAASKTLMDLAAMSQITLMDMLRLRQIAQMAANQANSQSSAPVLDEKALAEAIAALNVGVSVNPSLQTPALANFPPNVIDLQQLEAAIHRRQQEEEEVQKQAVTEEPAIVHCQQLKELEAETVKIPMKDASAPQQSQKKRKEKNKLAPQPQEERMNEEIKQTVYPVAKQEQQSVASAAATTNGTKKKKKRSKNANATPTPVETKPEEKSVGTEEALTGNAGFLEPEDDWVAVPASGVPFNPHLVSQNVTFWQKQNEPEKNQTSKKSKKKKRGKLSVAELQQQAWEQEEERRRKANAERIAREEAEKAALAEETAAASSLAASSNVKLTAAERRQLEEAQRARQQQLAREAARREAEASLASFKLPPTAKWAKNATAATPFSASSAAPTPMVDILAAQMQEEEFERTKPNAGHATFASKVASGSHQPPSSTTNKLKYFAPANTQAAVPAPKPQLTKQPAKPGQRAPVTAVSKAPLTSKTNQPAAASTQKTMNVTSIWNMAVETNVTSKSASTKKDRKKKKATANSNLLTGSIISLTPKARQELVRWCENKLSAFQSGDVDIPTLISVLCDMEEDDAVLECIESSFGKSQRVSKFSKAFVEKRATLMGATA